ncbi:unnamed protein product [Cuscuta epithymum]|uniref:Uncharacterized protein n=1 Tax=Cuscuta epithymum TaxID=186058 RepID=A0AAV0DB44_9ASTE|nr:unnamed protein product [Cuscuta epithymum]
MNIFKSSKIRSSYLRIFKASFFRSSNLQASFFRSSNVLQLLALFDQESMKSQRIIHIFLTKTWLDLFLFFGILQSLSGVLQSFAAAFLRLAVLLPFSQLRPLFIGVEGVKI